MVFGVTVCPMRNTTSAPLPADDLKALRAMAETGDGIVVADFDVSEGTMIRALAGRAVKAVTARRIRLGLERSYARAYPPQPVCPRCLDVTPGTPGGMPEKPHPGPFTEKLCEACVKAVEPYAGYVDEVKP